MIPIHLRAWDVEREEMFDVARFDFADNTVYRHLFACSGILGEDCVIMQYTGLGDKYNKPIYLGDIGWDENLECYGVVKFDEGRFSYEWENISNDLFDSCDEIEIVGNVYENPELLEREE